LVTAVYAIGYCGVCYWLLRRVQLVTAVCTIGYCGVCYWLLRCVLLVTAVCAIGYCGVCYPLLQYPKCYFQINFNPKNITNSLSYYF